MAVNSVQPNNNVSRLQNTLYLVLPTNGSEVIMTIHHVTSGGMSNSLKIMIQE